MRYPIIKLAIHTFIFSFSISTSAQVLLFHDFDDGTLGGFESCTTKSPNYVTAVDGRLKTYWTASGFDGGRVSKGAEACGIGEYTTRKEGWMGMYLNVHENYPRDKEAAIMQIFGFENNRSKFTWEGMIQIIDGDLTLVHRVAGTGTNAAVYPDFPYGEDVSVIIHFVLSSNNNGEIEVWVNGKSEFRVTGINFGFGSFNDNDEQYDDTYTELKMGQYNYDDAEYETDEERIVYFDNVAWYNGADGYDIVDPSDSNNPGYALVSMRKGNASVFAIDGNHGGANAQDVYLWSFGADNVNQLWQEIDRGNNYFSYKKLGTNYCLDGDHGGENRQNVYLWACSENNQNQHWKKVSTENGRFRLEKRNAPGFSIDGNHGGDNRQSIYLWSSDSANQNQQWIFTEH